MERITEELSEIAYSLRHLAEQFAANTHLTRKPTWDEVANHIAHRRFPRIGLPLRPTLISLAVRRMILEYDPELINQRDVALKYSGRPDLFVTVHKSYGSPLKGIDGAKRPDFLEKCQELREVYRILLINPDNIKAYPDTYLAHGEGIILIGSPSRLQPFVQIKDHILPGITSIKDYPGNTVSSNVEDHRKSVVMRTLRRIGC